MCAQDARRDSMWNLFIDTRKRCARGPTLSFLNSIDSNNDIAHHSNDDLKNLVENTDEKKQIIWIVFLYINIVMWACMLIRERKWDSVQNLVPAMNDSTVLKRYCKCELSKVGSVWSRKSTKNSTMPKHVEQFYSLNIKQFFESTQNGIIDNTDSVFGEGQLWEKAWLRVLDRPDCRCTILQ